MRNLESLALYGSARAIEAAMIPALPALDVTESPNLGANGTSQEGNDKPTEQTFAVWQLAAEVADEPIVI